MVSLAKSRPAIASMVTKLQIPALTYKWCYISGTAVPSAHDDTHSHVLHFKEEEEEEEEEEPQKTLLFLYFCFSIDIIMRRKCTVIQNKLPPHCLSPTTTTHLDGPEAPLTTQHNILILCHSRHRFPSCTAFLTAGCIIG